MKNILVRYGELTLKGKNKSLFINKLISNIKFKLRPFSEHLVYIKDINSLTIELHDENLLNKVIEILSSIFGIYSLSVCQIVEKNYEKILRCALEEAKNMPAGTFKVEAHRKDKSFEIGSVDLTRKIATKVLKETNHLIVNVKNPQCKLEVIVKNKGVYIFSTRLKSSKGLPVGISGKSLSLLSGGIDSPVSSYLGLKRGLIVNFLHFATPPHTSEESIKKVMQLAKQLYKYNVSSAEFYLCDFSKVLSELMHIEKESYRIILMRRAFMIIANGICEINGYNSIITGESLGQVASQTISSMNVVNSLSKKIILRPLITSDKEEIISIAKEIGTYDISILPYDDVCSMYVPKAPTTNPKEYICEDIEKEILFHEMIKYTLENCIKIYYFKDGEFYEKKQVAI